MQFNVLPRRENSPVGPALPCALPTLFFLLCSLFFTSLQAQTTTRYQAETGNNGNVSTATTHAGYSGSGYVTNLTSEWSKTGFGFSNNQQQSAQLDIRYANGTGAPVTNLALYVGSGKVQDLVFPVTAGWTGWTTMTVYITVPAGYQGISIEGESNVSQSVNIDYFDLTLGVSGGGGGGGGNTSPPGAFAQTSPAAGATGISLSPTLGWAAATDAASYNLVVSTAANYSNPVVSTTGLGGTSFTVSAPLSAGTTYYWRVTAVNTNGNTVATNAGSTFSTQASGGGGGGTPPTTTGTVYEAESINRGNVSVASTHAGYSGTGYVTGMTSQWSHVGFERSYSSPAAVQVNIRYANGTSSNVTNLALYQGSSKITDLVLPPTGSWSSWDVVSVSFQMPVGYQGIKINGTSNVSTSANIDYLELITGAVTIPPGSFTQTAPTNNSTGVSTLPTLTWSSSSSAQSYRVEIATTMSFASTVINQAGLTATSFTPTTALANSQTYYWRVKATNADGTTTASNAGISFTTMPVPPAPGVFSLTAPAGGAAGVSTLPAFSWQAASNAASYRLQVSTSTSFASPAVDVSGITGTSYLGASLAANTTHYWRVIASNGAGSRTAANAGLSFTTGAAAPPQPSQAGIIRDFFDGITGAAVSNLTGNAAFPNNPTSTGILSTFDAPRQIGDYYGQRIHGYLAPTTTGNYEFWIAADDDAQLWLSTNDQAGNKVLIASVTGWTNPDQFDKFGSQKSASIPLTAGQYYYIEALHKENEGGDHLTAAWKLNGGSRTTITSAHLVTSPPVPVPVPGAFSLSAPAANAAATSTTPAFSWGASSDAYTYHLVVSTNSNFSNPVISRSDLTGTSFTPSTALAGGTLHYWKVTAVNSSGSKVAGNAPRSFTTLVPPIPAAFTQTAPASNATDVNRFPAFTWQTAANATGYDLIVSKASNLSNPVINKTGLTATSYTHGTSLDGSTKYYWRVTAKNGTGNRVATNGGISFTTKATIGNYYYVDPSGVDAPGRGSSASPYKTLAYAAGQVPALANNTIYLNPGTYVETQAVKVPRGVNIEGAGESLVTVTANGPIAPPPGIDQTSGDWKLWYYGSLIQLYSAGYQGGPEIIYGSPTQMVASSDGDQTLSGFTVDGNNKQVKAGIWVQNRNNVTMHHVTVQNCQQRGAVFTRSDMWWYEPMPDGMWMYNTTIHDCTFYDNGAQLGSETLGNLCLAGLDGANIYNIFIDDPVGYGIKFIMVGHYRNVKIHDCNITVNENDAQWGEKISIELWNLDQGNEVYNIVCNTWHSYVNHNQLVEYEPSGTQANNLKVYNVRMIDADGSSSKEAIEAALSGVQIYDCYIQDKGFGIAIWNGQGGALKKNYIIRNNIFTNVNRAPAFGFGKSSAVFVPDAAQNVKIHNNVFDRMGNGLNLDGVNGGEVINNVFINSLGADIENGSSIVMQNNLKYHADPQKTAFILTGGVTLGTGNITGLPGFTNSGPRWTTYYRPASSTAKVVDAGKIIGLPYNGSKPDIGRWEFGTANRSVPGSEPAQIAGAAAVTAIDLYPNPAGAEVILDLPYGLNVEHVVISNAMGQVVRTLVPGGESRLRIDLNGLARGVYTVSVLEPEGKRTLRLIKE
ncbi:MAG: PA14 domain-containing protein [Saprospiraceae bacterium]